MVFSESTWVVQPCMLDLNMRHNALLRKLDLKFHAFFISNAPNEPVMGQRKNRNMNH